jgi:adenosylhomocysteine nucleosidase
MPRLAIVSALHEELAAVLALMPDARRITVAGREFCCGALHGQEVVAVLSRVGKVAAATTATVLAERFAVEGLVFTGVAGGLGDGVRVGDVVVGSAFLQHDLDASPIFPKYEVPLYGVDRFRADTSLAEQLACATARVLGDPVGLLGRDAVDAFALASPRLHRGLVVSGDRFVSTTTECHALRAALPDALAVEMEGAAIAQVCHDYGLPFAAVRTISDRADDAAHVDFLHFIREVASRYSAGIVDALLRARA